MGNFKQGIFKPKNKKKYIGNADNIVFRSGWELRVMNWLDQNTNVIEWCSEELMIPYFFQGDGKTHRYYPDFLIKLKSKNGVNRKIIIEVKPAKETVLPKKPKRMTKKSKVRYLNECMTYQKNSDKWESATAYAKKNGMEFKIMTEYDIYGQKGK